MAECAPEFPLCILYGEDEVIPISLGDKNHKTSDITSSKHSPVRIQEGEFDYVIVDKAGEEKIRCTHLTASPAARIEILETGIVGSEENLGSARLILPDAVIRTLPVGVYIHALRYRDSTGKGKYIFQDSLKIGKGHV